MTDDELTPITLPANTLTVGSALSLEARGVFSPTPTRITVDIDGIRYEVDPPEDLAKAKR
jgi:hypothetical protein